MRRADAKTLLKTVTSVHLYAVGKAAPRNMGAIAGGRIAVPHRLRGLVGVRCGQLAAPNKCTSKLWLLAQSDTLHTKRRMTMSATPAVSVMARKLRFFAAADYRCTLRARRWLSAQHAPRGLLFGKRSRRRLAHRVCRLLAVAWVRC